MAKYKYESNKDPRDPNAALVLDGSLDSGGRRASLGEEVELSEEEYASLSEKYNLVKVSGGSSDSPVTRPGLQV